MKRNIRLTLWDFIDSFREISLLDVENGSNIIHGQGPSRIHRIVFTTRLKKKNVELNTL